MRIKVSLRYLNRLFNVGHIKVHDVFSDTLAPETMEALSEKFHTLSEFAEATDKELMAIPGVSEKTIKAMKESLSSFFKKYIVKDFIAGMPEDMAPSQRVAYAQLIEEAELYHSSVSNIKEAIRWLPEKEKKFIEMTFGLKGSKASRTEIAQKLQIPDDKLPAYKKMVLKRLGILVRH
ncbi:MAG: hypothetical protein IKD76_05780 [Clostridia bacterium]|nr:hypothetical protein [Clostridia bacterium]